MAKVKLGTHKRPWKDRRGFQWTDNWISVNGQELHTIGRKLSEFPFHEYGIVKEALEAAGLEVEEFTDRQEA